MTQVNAIKLYITVEPRTEVGSEEVQQTTTNLQLILPNDWCNTLKGYTPQCQKTPTPIFRQRYVRDAYKI